MWRKVHATANSFFNFGIESRAMAPVGDDVVDNYSCCIPKLYCNIQSNFKGRSLEPHKTLFQGEPIEFCLGQL